MHERNDLRLGTREEYFKLFDTYWNREDNPLGVYSSYTRMEGDWFGEGTCIETVWGLRGEDTAVCGCRREGETYETAEDTEYWANEKLLKEIGEQSGSTT